MRRPSRDRRPIRQPERRPPRSHHLIESLVAVIMGTIAIRLQSSDTRMSIDTGNLDPALVEELCELGYVR
jgi:hypothetical protein